MRTIQKLGSLSEKYESNGKPGAISNGAGDKGGPSYGLYQLSLNTGALAGYIAASKYKKRFEGMELGGNIFNVTWTDISVHFPIPFAQDQYDYHMKTYYVPVRKYLDQYNIPNTNAINQVIWSTSTQHGPGWAKEQFKALTGLSEETIIKSIYTSRRAQFAHSTYYNMNAVRRRIRDNVLKRYDTEEVEALNLIV